MLQGPPNSADRASPMRRGVNMATLGVLTAGTLSQLVRANDNGVGLLPVMGCVRRTMQLVPASAAVHNRRKWHTNRHRVALPVPGA